MAKRKNGSRGTQDSASYEVGYQKPPKHSQFKPGQSGNPKGRPKGHKNFKTTCRDVFAEKVVIREGERTRRVPKLEAVIRMTLNKALMNDSKAIGSFLQFVRFSGVAEEEAGSVETDNISSEDTLIVERFLRRHGAMVMPNRRQEDDPDSKEATVHLESEDE